MKDGVDHRSRAAFVVASAERALSTGPSYSNPTTRFTASATNNQCLKKERLETMSKHGDVENSGSECWNWPSKRVTRKPTLVVSIDALCALLIEPEDGISVLRALGE